MLRAWYCMRGLRPISPRTRSCTEGLAGGGPSAVPYGAGSSTRARVSAEESQKRMLRRESIMARESRGEPEDRARLGFFIGVATSRQLGRASGTSVPPAPSGAARRCGLARSAVDRSTCAVLSDRRSTLRALARSLFDAASLDDLRFDSSSTACRHGVSVCHPSPPPELSPTDATQSFPRRRLVGSGQASACLNGLRGSSRNQVSWAGLSLRPTPKLAWHPQTTALLRGHGARKTACRESRHHARGRGVGATRAEGDAPVAGDDAARFTLADQSECRVATTVLFQEGVAAYAMNHCCWPGEQPTLPAAPLPRWACCPMCLTGRISLDVFQAAVAAWDPSHPPP
ncbi:hypothetical protein VTN02DRAFT_5501 [Thermoascus thermophilus]